ncbi:RING-H2 finger protein ATL39-like [Rutidosis leptorrhynchoides]|uniref:RING-H2 finger protein ATL39-like n=1 Tax=Rutidosis leptorrhynchoides TaxID=125765 RepID=UPI003A998C16
MSISPDSNTGDSYTDDTGNSQGSLTYVFAISLPFIFLIILVYYVSRKCKSNINFLSQPDDVADNDDDQQRPIRVMEGVNEDILVTFPTFVYSEDTVNDVGGSGCSVCLVDYKRNDVIRSLPKCGHLFHRKCIDTWLRVHATCPVCRNSTLPARLAGTTVPLSHLTFVNRSHL